ncbi:EamA family transporter [Thalassovita sp.]|uniref:EamA family transporter n=1 Tax=Thalassovita sp. TaxID=1979401 RepID=UPI002881871A|nr:EamA family transporter [Thalassovita sp.]MDF1802677.1 EamA family transporter [Thalassovita sp.]
MTLAVFAIVFISVSLSALAQTAFKYGVSKVHLAESATLITKAMAFLFSPYVLLGLGLYGIGTVLWLFALRQLDLSLAYPFVAMSFVMVAASGMLFLGEPVNTGRLLGLGLIVLGLLVMARAA